MSNPRSARSVDDCREGVAGSDEDQPRFCAYILSEYAYGPLGKSPGPGNDLHRLHLEYSRILIEGFLRGRKGDTRGLIANYREALDFGSRNSDKLNGILSLVHSVT